jgi:SNF2 family DNA or RNA helicase
MENNPTNRMPIKAHPYEHQRRAFEFACRLFGLTGHDPPTSRGVALLMEMGTGKSLTTIAVAGRFWLDHKVERMLIVAPLSILGVWQEEFRKFAAFEYSLIVLNGSESKKIEKLRQMPTSGLQVAVINYESEWRLEKELVAWDADLIVCDEGHKIKTHNIAASKCMHRLGVKARYRMLLTGTIITNKAIDVFSPYKFLNPAVFGNSFYAFRNRYFDMTGYGNHTPVMKLSMADELTRRIHSIAYRATKAECIDLPETTEIVRTVELEPQAKHLYQQLVRDSYAQIKGGEITAANVLTRLLRLSQLTGGFLRGDEGDRVERVSSAKLDALSDIVDSAAQEGGKLVVIARFLPEIDAITRMLESKSIGYALITGAVNDRDEQVRRFQTDPDVTVFIGQIATAGLGITLTAADTMVFYSLDYSMSNFEQAKARIHRVGQRNPCTYIYLVADGTVDGKVLKALRDKADLAKALIDDCRAGKNPFGEP